MKCQSAALLKALKTVPGVIGRKRGELITRTGMVGVYVGTTPAGVDWVTWSGRVDEFETMCAAFDRLEERA